VSVSAALSVFVMRRLYDALVSVSVRNCRDTEKVSNTSSRTLRLLSLLQTHRYWPGSELAARLEVSVRTLRRDVDRLRELGYPVEANRGVDGGYQLAAGAAMPPLVLDDEEAVALAVGLQAAAQSGVAGVAEASVRALAKVVPVMPPRLRRRVEALRTATVAVSWTGGPAVDPAVLTAVAQACRDVERLEFGYAAADGTRTERHVEPFKLVSLGRRWYLVAYDLQRHGWRSFRLDRLQTPRATGARFRPRELPADDAAAFVRAGISHAPWNHEVEALVEAPAAAVRERVGRWVHVEEVDDGRCRLRMTTDSLDWALLALGAVGAEFAVLGPPELRDRMQAWGERFARAATSSAAVRPPSVNLPG
jgi:predicted DNA-binding transcriptional regulator YafY